MFAVTDIAMITFLLSLIFLHGKYERWEGKEKVKRRLGIIFRVLKGEEFVPRAEGSAVNDDTVVVVDFIGSLKTKRPVKDFYNPNTGMIEIISDLTNKTSEKGFENV